MQNKQTLSILLLAHPGHELRIHHWVELNKPLVFFLTDGSGSKEQSRTHYSREIIEKTGSAAGAIFGDISDRLWYDALARHDHGFFAAVIASIEADIGEHHSYRIVADARDGYNPIHDLASAMGAILQLRLSARGKPAELLFSAATAGAKGDRVCELVLDGEARTRKLAAVARYLPLVDEARSILKQYPAAMDREVLISQVTDWHTPKNPEWEEIGRERVAAGIYQSCLTYEDHFLPVVSKLFEECGK
ncbi:hypothetical protein [Phyllobacterium calauticae]|jgi:hypothetical protein|nr:hypothetical protein [Phyllobacterium calauticae]MBZ3691701.1 hypothetical protein [Phyllobacterium calauticae]